ncbi:MAG: TerB family tellurite resistance protein [Pseudomonadota bacterium]
MSIASLGNILKIFGGNEPSAEERQNLFREATLMTVSRATASDTNIKQVEVETVRDIYQRVTGEEISSADVRMAANSKLYESAPLYRYLGRVAKVIDVHERVTIAKALSEVILSDDHVSEAEVEFFNMVADSLQLSPAELAGLVPRD